MVVVVKVVKHARYGRDVEADPLPADTEEDVPEDTEEDVPEDTEEDVPVDDDVDLEGSGVESDDNQRATRGIRYKYITYKKKVIRSSICPNGKRPSYYDCTCY